MPKKALCRQLRVDEPQPNTIGLPGLYLSSESKREGIGRYREGVNLLNLAIYWANTVAGPPINLNSREN